MHKSCRSIKNIPLFKTKEIQYHIDIHKFENIIFQSISSAAFFNELESLKNKNVFSMGKSTQDYLSKQGVKSVCPSIPGSEELKKLLSKNKKSSNYLIVKGENGLSEISNYLNSSNEYVEEINCYKRFKLESYENVKNEFYDADAIIFPSNYAFKIFFEEIYSTKVKAKLFGISKRIIDYISSYDLDSDFIDYFSKDITESIKDSI
jgi:uroporphyrinogen-III synthase